MGGLRKANCYCLILEQGGSKEKRVPLGGTSDEPSLWGSFGGELNSTPFSQSCTWKKKSTVDVHLYHVPKENTVILWGKRVLLSGQFSFTEYLPSRVLLQRPLLRSHYTTLFQLSNHKHKQVTSQVAYQHPGRIFCSKIKCFDVHSSVKHSCSIPFMIMKTTPKNGGFQQSHFMESILLNVFSCISCVTLYLCNSAIRHVHILFTAPGFLYGEVTRNSYA